MKRVEEIPPEKPRSGGYARVDAPAPVSGASPVAPAAPAPAPSMAFARGAPAWPPAPAPEEIAPPSDAAPPTARGGSSPLASVLGAAPPPWPPAPPPQPAPAQGWVSSTEPMLQWPPAEPAPSPPPAPAPAPAPAPTPSSPPSSYAAPADPFAMPKRPPSGPTAPSPAPSPAPAPPPSISTASSTLPAFAPPPGSGLGDDLFGGVEAAVPQAAEPLTGKIPSLAMLGIEAPPKPPPAPALSDLEEPAPPKPPADFEFDVANDAVVDGSAPPASEMETLLALGVVPPELDGASPTLDDPTESQSIPASFDAPSTADARPRFDEMIVTTGSFQRPDMPPPSAAFGEPALSTPPTQRARTPRELASAVRLLGASLAAEGRGQDAQLLLDVEALLSSL